MTEASKDAAVKRASPADLSAGSSPRYPEYLLPIAGVAEERYERFCELREELLADYGYNSARAYWGDLDDIYRWAEERGKDVLALLEDDVRQYVALLRRRHYSEHTIRRRLVSYRLLRRLMAAED